MRLLFVDGSFPSASLNSKVKDLVFYVEDLALAQPIVYYICMYIQYQSSFCLVPSGEKLLSNHSVGRKVAALDQTYLARQHMLGTQVSPGVNKISLEH